jgi:uncharacterized membrane protein YeaQ/YmgE (transglycosylase-associated protein family)
MREYRKNKATFHAVPPARVRPPPAPLLPLACAWGRPARPVRPGTRLARALPAAPHASGWPARRRGAVAKWLMPGPDPGGWIVTILLGIAGALVGGFLGRAAGWYGPNDAAGFLMPLVGALVLLGLYRLTLRRHT